MVLGNGVEVSGDQIVVELSVAHGVSLSLESRFVWQEESLYTTVVKLSLEAFEVAIIERADILDLEGMDGVGQYASSDGYSSEVSVNGNLSDNTVGTGIECSQNTDTGKDTERGSEDPWSDLLGGTLSIILVNLGQSISVDGSDYGAGSPGLAFLRSAFLRLLRQHIRSADLVWHLSVMLSVTVAALLAHP